MPRFHLFPLRLPFPSIMRQYINLHVCPHTSQRVNLLHEPRTQQPSCSPGVTWSLRFRRSSFPSLLCPSSASHSVLASLSLGCRLSPAPPHFPQPLSAHVSRCFSLRTTIHTYKIIGKPEAVATLAHVRRVSLVSSGQEQSNIIFFGGLFSNVTCLSFSSY